LALVVWYATSFGWTEIVFDKFLEKIFSNFSWDVSLVRKCRYYNKGAKPTVDRSKSGLTGTQFIRELICTIGQEIKYNNNFPDMLIVSDDADCRLQYDSHSKRYIYDCNAFQQEVQKLTNLIHNHHQATKIVFMFASPEIESWFLVDCNNTFCKAFQSFTLQGLANSSNCQNFFPLSDLENYGGSYINNSCQDKLSDVCIKAYPPASRYSKREHGQQFLIDLDPQNLSNLQNFFMPAYNAIANKRDFIP
jgi:hypothetical protein